MTEQRPSSGPTKVVYSAEELIERLRRALRKDGDFPASAKIVKEIAELTADPKTTANQLSELILREPTLGMRVLHIVNSSFYQRAKPIMTVSQAVVQIGMKPLAEICSNLVLLQRFVPVARRGGAFAGCLRQSILTTITSTLITAELQAPGAQKKGESGQLFGLFYEIGSLLLAFYFPQVYEAAVRRAEEKKLDFAQALHQITGLTPAQLSLEVLQALQLPEFYSLVIKYSEDVKKKPASFQDSKNEVYKAASTVCAAKSIATVLAEGKGKEELDSALATVKLHLNLPASVLTKLVGSIPAQFNDYCSTVELQLPPLPTYVESYALEGDGLPAVAANEEEDAFTQYVSEIRQAVDSREPTASIITTVMETLAWGLGFDRVVLLLMTPHRKQLAGRMALGKVDSLNPASLVRPVGAEASPFAPDAAAFQDSRPVFAGDPILEGGWPLVAIPIGFGKRAVGVIYADKVGGNEAELTDRHQAAVGLLAELLDRSISVQQG